MSEAWSDALVDVVFFSAVVVRFFHFINKRNSSPTLQRSRRMLCRPNPSPDSAEVWLPLPIDLSLHITFRPRFLFSTVVFFPLSSRLFLAYPQHSSPYYTQPSYLRFVSSFQFLYAVPNTCLHICLCAKPLPTKPTIFNGTCLKYM